MGALRAGRGIIGAVAAKETVVDWTLYGQLSVMMFLQFAIWGAWAPVLAAHLLGKLKLSGKQTSLIYATLPIACIVSPFLGGQIADRWMATEQFLALVSVTGGVALLIAAWRKTFASLFFLMLLYSLLFAPTLALTNSMMFVNLRKAARPGVVEQVRKAHEADPKFDENSPAIKKEIKDKVQTELDKQSPWIRVWGTIGWIVAGLGLAFWRRGGKQSGRFSDCLLLGGIFSVALGLYCFFLPHTPPPDKPSDPLAFREAFKMLAEPNFLIFMIISFIVTTELQFYYIPTAQFLEDIGIKNKNVPAVMTLAQMAEVIGMFVLLPFLLPRIGYKWGLAIGVLAWPGRYVIFALMKPVWLVVSSLPFHGIGYTFFFFLGQMFVDKVAGEDIRGSAQALVFGITVGLGNLLGTQFTGFIMDHFKQEGKFNWRPIFLVPCVLTVACAIAFLALFRG
jgi:MFS family permease